MTLFPHENDFNHEMLRASQEEGTPLSVLKGFFALESQFNPKSYRAEPEINDASYGIAQILFKTAQKLGYSGTPEGLYDPYTSAKYGAKFLAQLHRQYPDNLDVIAAYNAGYPRPISATTAYIANLYKYPISYKTNPPAGWVYANQCYVDRVAAYIAYYQAVERNDLATANTIAGILRQKSNWPAEFGKYTIARGYLRPIYWSGKVVDMKTFERWGLALVSVGIIYFALRNLHTAVHGEKK
jgi:hypothetical protein